MPAAVQVHGTVLTVRRVDDYRAMTITAPTIAQRFKPGQFLALAVGGADGEPSVMPLRRAFAVHGASGDHGGAVEFVFAVRGSGTRWLADRRPRDRVDVIGPLGRPFPMPRDPARCLLVGDEHGSVPLFPLAGALAGRRCRVDFLLGAATATRLFGAVTARRVGEVATIVTDDGTLGSRGRVTDALARAIDAVGCDVIYASGPLGMLRRVADVAADRDVPAQAYVQDAMACGIGTCLGCVLPVVGADEVTRMAPACVAGPALPADRVRWHDAGTIPFDALGAPGGAHRWETGDIGREVPGGR